MTAEDRIHLALVLALGAANFALCWGGPSTSPASAGAVRASSSRQPIEVTPAELEAAIEQLERWLAPTRSLAARGSPYPPALQALGPTPDDRAHPERWLARVLGADAAGSWLAPTAGVAPDGTPQGLTAALVVLLETGVSLERSLTSGASEKAPTLQLSELVRRALDATAAPARASHNPWQLDLMSLAVLGGLSQYRERLGLATHQGLRQLELRQRALDAQPGSGELDDAQLEQLAQARRQAAASAAPEAPELHWSAALFRATAVLAETDLEDQARRHLNALLARYQRDRALYRYLQRKARSARERRALQIEALEQLGRFEEALFNAHLTFRNGTAAGPSAETAQVMRLAARDLIDQLQGLEARDFEPAPSVPEQNREELLRAAVQALRGLRTARVAG